MDWVKKQNIGAATAATKSLTLRAASFSNSFPSEREGENLLQKELLLELKKQEFPGVYIITGSIKIRRKSDFLYDTIS